MPIVLLIVAAVVAAGVVFVATRPDHFRVERSVRIAAPPATVHAIVDDLRRWEAWSPWAKKDPGMRTTLGGAERGVGQTYAWEGNKQVGKGEMEIVASTAPSSVVLALHFIAPFEARNTAEFTLLPEGDGTRVTWALTGPANVMTKLMSLFKSMDAMVGPDFETGLESLKRVAETEAAS